MSKTFRKTNKQITTTSKKEEKKQQQEQGQINIKMHSSTNLILLQSISKNEEKE